MLQGLVGVLPGLMGALERHGERSLDPAVRAALLQMSAATMDRRLAPTRRHLGRRPFTQSRSVGALKALVPLAHLWGVVGCHPGRLPGRPGGALRRDHGRVLPHHPHAGGRGHQLAGL